VSVELLSEECWLMDGRAAVFAVRERARELARSLGLSVRSAEAVTIAVSELASNIIDHAGTGEIVMQTQRDGERHVLVAIARDPGPGIRDLEWALTDGCSSGNGLGCGLSAVRRLMDEFTIESTVGKGTSVTIKKWLGSPVRNDEGRPLLHGRS
jgi:serine/threonine-protein kinase RsbT